MRCPKPITLMNLFAAAGFAAMLATAVTRSEVIAAAGNDAQATA
jgi:hypothetical protein